MNRRTFISATGSVGFLSLLPANAAESPAVAGAGAGVAGADASEFTAGSAPGPVLAGSPVVAGPAPDAITILQPLHRHATGHLEYAIEDGPFRRVDAAAAGLLPFDPHVLKFRLPPMPPGRLVRYRLVARSVGWVRVREFVHGRIVPGPVETGPEHTFRTLDPNAGSTRFVVWNDTHENPATLAGLHEKTGELKPDFLVWNGDQSNDIHQESEMASQFLSPRGLAIANGRPLAYVRGNHDVRGPAARHLPRFTGTPGDRYYYGFRSGPLAALVMDTGEDKDDDSPWLGGVTDFAAMRREQAGWLESVTKEPWFRDARFRVLFCHIPLWFVRELKGSEWSEYSKPCREAWLPSLTAAGVKLILSGHTHHPAWMPAREGQPIGQLIGGGPQTRYATLIHGTATHDRLSITMQTLDGTALERLDFTA